MATSTSAQPKTESMVAVDLGPRIPFTLMDALSLTLAMVLAALFVAAYLREQRQKNVKK